MHKVSIIGGVFQIPCEPHVVVPMRDGDAIVTVNHEDAKMIYSRKKHILLTHVRPPFHLAVNFWIYEPMPIARITGVAIFAGCTVYPKCYVPRSVLKRACTNLDYIDAEYQGKLFVPTVRLIDARRLETPLALYNVGLQYASEDYIMVDIAKQIPSAIL